MLKYLRKHILLLILFTGIGITVNAQVNLTATAGTLTGTYTTLGAAFTAINAGTHMGIITIGINSNTLESGPCTLHSSGAGPASYNSVHIFPTGDNITVTGTSGAGRGLIELNGADTVSIDGDNPNTAGINRNLTLINTSTTTYSSTIRIAMNTTTVNSANNNSIINLNINGGYPGRNVAGATSATGTENTTYGILVTGAANSATAAPTAISSVTTTIGSGGSATNLLVKNNFITNAARGITLQGSNINVFTGLVVDSNIIGNPVIGSPDGVYSIGISVQGSSNAIVKNNRVYIEGQVSSTTATRAIDCGSISATGSGTLIENNIVGKCINNNPATSAAVGINVNGGSSHIIRNNQVTNMFANQTAVVASFSSTAGTYGIRLSSGTGHQVIHNSVYLTGNILGTTSTLLTSAFALTGTGVNSCDVRNNIFSNKITGGNPTGTIHACITLPASATVALNLTLNNNAYYAGTDPNSRLAQVGFTYGAGEYLAGNFIASATVPATNFRSYTSTLETNGTNDNTSFANTTIPPFVSANDLHIPAGTTTRLESGGATTSLLVDIDGQLRPGPVGSVNGGALAPDIGADEFDGIPLLIDVGVLSLIEPSAGCHGSSDSVRIRLRNFSIQAIDFSVNPVTINTSVTGVNPAVFPTLVLNSGTLAAQTNLDTTIATNYNMSALGTYIFHSIANVLDDSTPANDSISPVTIVVSGGTASSNVNSTCVYNSVILSVTGYTTGGTVQWQYFSPNTLTWTNYPGGNVNPFSTLITDSTDHYRALICNINPSNEDSVAITTVPPPTGVNASRCGAGQITLTAPGSSLRWYDAPTGGNLLDTGNVFITNVVTTTNFYLETTAGSVQQNVGPLNNAIGAGGGFAGPQWLLFDATAPFTLVSFIIYPTQAGNADIELRNSVGTVIQSISIPITAAQINNPVTVTPYWVINPGSQYRLATNATTSINLYRNTLGAVYPYTIPGVVSITGNSFDVDYYYYFYDWIVESGCSSTRDTVTAIVTPADTIVATAITNPLCSDQTTAINITSSNPNYQYTWSPAVGLNVTSGPSVTTNSDTSIVYTVNAFDNSSQCATFTNISIVVNAAPTVNIVTPDTALCANTNLQFDLTVTSHVNSSVVIGSGTTSNTASSTTILGPYGGYHGGARHQYLFTAGELLSYGLTAGSIDQLAFEVTNLNSVSSLGDYTIKMGNTSLNAMTISFVPGLNTLFYDTAYIPNLGWNSHDIDPFIWDGVSNIIVEVCFNNENTGITAGNASVRYSTVAQSVLYYRADTDPNVCGMLSGTISGSRPNIRFIRNNPLNYVWSPAVGLNNPNSMEPTLTAISTNTYTVQLTDSINGCTANDNVMITVNPEPVFNIGNDTLVCENNTFVPFAIYGSDINLNYVWFDNTTGSGAIVNAPGTYYATGTNAGGCFGTDTLIVGTAQAADVDINIDIISNNMAELDAGSGFTSYTWSNSQTTQVATVSGNGTYWVQVIDANGCYNADTISIVFSLGLSNPDGTTGELIFYPNPSNGWVNMAGTNIMANALQLDIMDINGKVVYTRNIENPGENFLQQLDLTGVADGTYIIRVQTEQSVLSNRIIIARN